MNVGGAFDRPIAADIWKIVQAKMENPDSELDIAIQNRGYYSSVLWNIVYIIFRNIYNTIFRKH